MAEEFGMKVFIELAAKNIKQIEDNVKSQLKNIDLKFITDQAKNAAQQVTKIFSSIKTGDLSKAAEAAKRIKDALTTAKAGETANFSNIGKEVSKAISPVKSVNVENASQIGLDLSNSVKEMGDISKGAISELGDDISKAVSPARSVFVENVSKIGQDVASAVKGIGGASKGVQVGESAAKIGVGAGEIASATTAQTGALTGSLASMGLVLGGILIAIVAIKKLAQKAISTLQRSSPFFAGILSVLNKAMSLFFRPFGDFLGALLRPLAIVLLRAAVSWIKFTRKFIPKPGEGGLGQGIGDAIGNIKEKIEDADIGELLKENIPKAIKGFFDIGEWLGERLADFVVGTFKFGIWLGERLADIVVGIFDFGVWLGEGLADYVKGNFDLGQWLTDNIHPFIGGVFNVGEWLGENLEAATFNLGIWLGEQLGDIMTGQFDWTNFGNIMVQYFTGEFDIGDWLDNNFGLFISGPFKVGEWLGEHLADYFVMAFKVGEWLADVLVDFITGEFDIGNWLWTNLSNWVNGGFDIGEWIKGFLGSGKRQSTPLSNIVGGDYQTGTDFVPQTGLALLHRGEKVIPAQRARRGDTGKTVNITNNFNLGGGGYFGALNELDAGVRGAARMTELEFRSRGIL